MRHSLRHAFAVLALAAMTSPAWAQEHLTEHKPMDLGADHAGTISQIGLDLTNPPHQITWWFDAGLSYPVGTLKDSNIDPGLLLRVNNVFWRNDGAFSAVGSIAGFWGNDSYFNESQNEAAFNVPPFDYSQTIQSRYYTAVPAMMEMQFAPHMDNIAPIFSLGPGVVWAHESVITSAVSDGVGSISLGDTTSTLNTGFFGEQEISPVAIRSRTSFNLGWQARAGIGFRMSSGPQPLWMRIVASGTTYYNHTSPRTLFGVVASFGR